MARFICPKCRGGAFLLEGLSEHLWIERWVCDRCGHAWIYERSDAVMSCLSLPCEQCMSEFFSNDRGLVEPKAHVEVMGVLVDRNEKGDHT